MIKYLKYQCPQTSLIPENCFCENDHEIILQEIISTDKINFFDPDAINREKRFYGLSIPNLNGTLSDEERIELLLKPLIPSD